MELDLFGPFCTEAEARLRRIRANLSDGQVSMDRVESYNRIHQELDSLHGAARAAHLAEWELWSRLLARLVRALRRQLPGPWPAARVALQEGIARLESALAGGFPPDAGAAAPVARLLTMRDGEPQTEMTAILIVDDSATSRLLFRVHLPRDAGYEVLEADSEEKALAVCRERRPDLVVLDYNMPGRNGVEIGSVVRALAPDTRMVLLTANTQRSVVEAAHAAGFSSVVEKPITAEKIKELLAGQQL